jgi:hypothetical protein
LPPCSILDKILHLYLNQERSVDDIIAKGFDRDTVIKVVHLINKSEYKRRQAPIGIRVNHKAFGQDRRYPITSGFSFKLNITRRFNMLSNTLIENSIKKFYDRAMHYAYFAIEITKKRHNQEIPNESLKPQDQIKSIISFSIKAIKNEIFSRLLQKQYTHSGYLSKSNPAESSLNVLNQLIMDEHDLTKCVYKSLSLELREELKGVLNAITQWKYLWKDEYLSIMLLCKFPIPREIVASMPSNEGDGFHLLNDTPHLFRPLDAKNNPRHIESIQKDDQLIVRVWKNKDEEIQCVSFEAREYRCHGSLFLSPVYEMNDFHKRVFFNNYISLSTSEKTYYRDSLQTIDKLLMLHPISNIPLVILNVINEYLNPTVASLIETDVELYKNEPTHIFHISKVNSEKIWEYFLNYDEYNKAKSKDPYILLKNSSDILEKSFEVLMKSISNNGWLYGDKLRCDSIGKYKSASSEKEKVNNFLEILSDIQKSKAPVTPQDSVTNSNVSLQGP